MTSTTKIGAECFSVTEHIESIKLLEYLHAPIIDKSYFRRVAARKIEASRHHFDGLPLYPTRKKHSETDFWGEPLNLTKDAKSEVWQSHVDSTELSSSKNVYLYTQSCFCPHFYLACRMHYDDTDRLYWNNCVRWRSKLLPDLFYPRCFKVLKGAANMRRLFIFFWMTS